MTLRLADEGDEARLLAWQCEPGARAFAREPAVPRPEEHRTWLHRRLADPECWLAIVEHDGAPAGMLRLDRLDAEGGFELSILVGKDGQGRGVGRAALALARRLVAAGEIVAEVLSGNAASFALFRGAGYREAEPGRFLAPSGEDA